MHIDSYRFGQILIDGMSCNKDVILLDNRVLPNWWRQQGHSLCLEDLEQVIAAGPARLILGQGKYGQMRVPEETVAALEGQGIQVEAYATEEAVARFNQAQPDEKVAAALHLTC